MRLIVSACKGVDAHEDAVQTGFLIMRVATLGLRVDLAQGVWRGKHEAALVVTGFISDVHVQRVAGQLAREFRQEAVVTETQLGQVYLWRHDEPTPLGKLAKYRDVAALAQQFGGALPEAFTVLSDGSVLYAAEPVQHDFVLAA